MRAGRVARPATHMRAMRILPLAAFLFAASAALAVFNIVMAIRIRKTGGDADLQLKLKASFAVQVFLVLGGLVLVLGTA